MADAITNPPPNADEVEENNKNKQWTTYIFKNLATEVNDQVWENVVNGVTGEKGIQLFGSWINR